MLAHLAAVAREARVDAGLRQIDIATTAGVSHGLISHFERAQAWPKDPERIINAYARETGTTAVDLWATAVRRYGDS